MVGGAAVGAEKDPGFFAALRMTQTKRQNPESRAVARCTRTLTFILSLTGRGDRRSRAVLLSRLRFYYNNWP